MNQNEIFAANLITKRKDKGLTQTKLAEKLEVKCSRVGAWEEGRGFPSPSMLTRICDILDVDDLYLFLTKPVVLERAYFS